MKYVVGALYRSTIDGADSCLRELRICYCEADSWSIARSRVAAMPREQRNDEYGQLVSWELIKIVDARETESLEDGAELFRCYIDKRDSIDQLLSRPPLMIHVPMAQWFIFLGGILTALILSGGSLYFVFSLLLS